MVKKKLEPLPNCIIALPNRDKKNFQECWTDKRMKDLCNFPHSFRMCLIAKPGAGKTNLIMNILLHQKPEFERIIIWSPSELSTEYKDLEYEYFDHCPSEMELLEELDMETNMPCKQIVIVEDIDLQSINKTDQINLIKLLKHYSSHFNTSVILVAHDLTQVPPIIRNFFNIFVLWKLSNITCRILGARFNIDNLTFFNMFRTECLDYHDCLCIDDTINSPCKYRKNIFIPLDENVYKNNIDLKKEKFNLITYK